jgi:copper chaperone NosL
MEKYSRWLIFLSVALIFAAFWFPLWDIAIFAPQYPEGLFLQIWINKMGGDLRNVNILNHYIGMHAITPESIPELQFMPYIAIGLMASGVLVGFLNKRPITVAWVVIFTLVAVAGLADFYKWEYDYGHDLNPDAPIKIPGMHYQPPFIGSQTLLNISAFSYPGIGGFALIASIGFAYLAAFGHLVFNRKKNHPSGSALR